MDSKAWCVQAALCLLLSFKTGETCVSARFSASSVVLACVRISINVFEGIIFLGNSRNREMQFLTGF